MTLFDIAIQSCFLKFKKNFKLYFYTFLNPNIKKIKNKNILTCIQIKNYFKK